MTLGANHVDCFSGDWVINFGLLFSIFWYYHHEDLSDFVRPWGGWASNPTNLKRTALSLWMSPWFGCLPRRAWRRRCGCSWLAVTSRREKGGECVPWPRLSTTLSLPLTLPPFHVVLHSLLISNLILPFPSVKYWAHKRAELSSNLPWSFWIRMWWRSCPSLTLALPFPKTAGAIDTLSATLPKAPALSF